MGHPRDRSRPRPPSRTAPSEREKRHRRSARRALPHHHRTWDSNAAGCARGMRSGSGIHDPASGRMTSGSRPRGCLVSPIMRRRHDRFNPSDRKGFREPDACLSACLLPPRSRGCAGRRTATGPAEQPVRLRLEHPLVIAVSSSTHTRGVSPGEHLPAHPLSLNPPIHVPKTDPDQGDLRDPPLTGSCSSSQDRTILTNSYRRRSGGISTISPCPLRAPRRWIQA